MKKGLMLGITFLIVILLSIPAHGMIVKIGFRSPTCFGITHYVGGDGPNNYTTIQQAISNASNGDIVFVFNESSPYFEHLIINVSIQLVGENKTTTIIDGENQGDVVIFNADDIIMTGFTVQHSGDTPKVDAGIESRSKRNVITDNLVIQNGQYAIGILLNGSLDTVVTENFISENGNEGVFLQDSFNCTIKNNVFTKNGHCAVIISHSSRNLIAHNTMYENYATVSLWSGAIDNEIAWNLMQNQEYSGVGVWPGANDNFIHHNYLSNNSLYGFIITCAEGNIIANNTILGSNEGVRLIMSNTTMIKFNNFIDNNISSFFENSSFNRWKQNYWDDHHGIWPKCIKGIMRLPWNKMTVIHWLNIDWFPAQKPYETPLSGSEV